MDDIDEEIKDYSDDPEYYKTFANNLKDQGNEAFQAGDIKGAIAFFTQAIDLDPDNHVFYSNRAAAYMKGDSKSKALKDAEKCVELAPDFAKGYSRLGAAQQSLRRFHDSFASFKKGIELEPNNKTLWTALKAAEKAHQLDKKKLAVGAQRERAAEEARLKKQSEIKADIAREKARQEEQDRQEEELLRVQREKAKEPVGEEEEESQEEEQGQ